MTGFKYCYGPVGSWRLGVSLGVDPVSGPEKVCDFDCVYCQLGHAAPSPAVRKVFVPAEELGGELDRIGAKADHLTFSGAGEPTLAANLPELIGECGRRRREKKAVITNASLIYSAKVRAELAAFDFVIAKLDAPDEELFRAINRPAAGIFFDEIVKGLEIFSGGPRKRLAIQTMFIGYNKAYTRALAEHYAAIRPDEVQLNTPLRSCAETPLGRNEMAAVCLSVRAELERLGASCIKLINVYGDSPPCAEPVSGTDSLKRRGKL